ncbi:MAG: Rpn family recombination-promoting nuclease/putative transposase [Bacteroidales bacterium]|nr:Rpn family recombination-promoting nuclease/putative transposase [Bacteroidales bacterium]
MITTEDEHFLRFDWAMKYVLRDKANFSVLEGLLTVFLGERVQVVELLESEGNRLRKDDKFNRVDVKAKNSHGDLILVEVQQSEEYYYLQRILYGAAKAITEHIAAGDRYTEVKKVYSINIIYFDWEKGKTQDYLYHGQTCFKGWNTGDPLEISQEDRVGLRMLPPQKVFPEYFLLLVNAFDKEPETPMEEWMDYLKRGRIRPDTTTPGLVEAKRRLDFLKLTPQEQREYERYLDDRVYEKDVLTTSHNKGMHEGFSAGLEEGLEQGRAEGEAVGRANSLKEIARKMREAGYPPEEIERMTGA